MSPITIVMDASGTRSSSATVCDERRPDVLPDLDLAGADRDLAGFVDVQPRGEIGDIARAAGARVPIPVPRRFRRRDEHEQPGAEDPDEVAPLELERVAPRLSESS